MPFTPEETAKMHCDAARTSMFEAIRVLGYLNREQRNLVIAIAKGRTQKAIEPFLARYERNLAKSIRQGETRSTRRTQATP